MGEPTYKGMVAWTDDFDESKDEHIYATYDKKPRRLVDNLMTHVGDGELVSLEIKAVNTD